MQAKGVTRVCVFVCACFCFATAGLICRSRGSGGDNVEASRPDR